MHIKNASNPLHTAPKQHCGESTHLIQTPHPRYIESLHLDTLKKFVNMDIQNAGNTRMHLEDAAPPRDINTESTSRTSTGSGMNIPAKKRPQTLAEIVACLPGVISVKGLDDSFATSLMEDPLQRATD
ncbi:hypothetical protein MSAN_02068700 [Mycena sanguinolenta]|uniref:Uncharacterized protein n=1 Tax=Mycena sanguinolenta TaxID=230812 RepID=A0A8H6XHN7_9AGAR|nr:hypothetical protein MSAN_02068700 [Mycena sanguinolenta]